MYVARRKVTTSTTGAMILEMGLILSSHTISMTNCIKLITIRAKLRANRAPMKDFQGMLPFFFFSHVQNLKGRNDAKSKAGT